MATVYEPGDAGSRLLVGTDREAKLEVAAAGFRENGRRERVHGDLLDRSGVPDDLIGRLVAEGLHRQDLRTPRGHGPGLVEQEHRDARKRLERPAALHDDAVLCGA